MLALTALLERSHSSSELLEDDELQRRDDATGLQDLPFELLLLILEYASPPALGTPKEAVRRYAFLRSMSLVSRTFRGPAQATLFASLALSKPTMASRWLTSPLLGMYATQELDLAGVHAGEGLSGTTAARIIGRAVGVRWLRLQDFKRLSCRLLAAPSLSGE